MSGIPYFQAPQDFLIYERNYVTKCTSTGATYSGFCIIFWIWVFGRALDFGLWVFWSVDFSGSGRANSFEATSFESGTFPMTRFLSAWRRCSTVWTSSFSATISSHSTRILKIKMKEFKLLKLLWQVIFVNDTELLRLPHYRIRQTIAQSKRLDD